MKFKQTIFVALPALLCGALMGYFASPSRAPAETPAADEAEVKTQRPRHSRPRSGDADLNRLRQRIKELEGRLADRGERDAQPQEESAEPVERHGRHGPEGFRARMEEMREKDPQRYAEMTNHFAAVRERHIQRVQDRLALLAAMDTSRMSPKQRENHLRYQELVARQTEIGDQLRPSPENNLSDEDRQQLSREIRDISRELHRLSDVERNTLLQQTALSFGLKGSTASEAVETIKAVIQATDNGWHGGPPGRHGGHGGPPRR